MSRVRTTQLAGRPTWSQYIEHANLPHGTGVWILDGDLTFRKGRVIFEADAFLLNNALSSHFLFTPDNTWNIGADGATRPKNIYAGSNVKSPNFIGGTASFELSVACDTVDGVGSPVFGLQTVGDTTRGRFTRSQNQDDYCLAVNLWTVYLAGIQWWLDDTSKTGLRFRSVLGTGWTFDIATAGANPRTLSTVAKIGTSGELYERSRTIALGEPQDVAYSAGNFSGDVGTWVVESADQIYLAYSLTGKTMVLFFDIRGSTTTGSPQYLKITIPGGFSVGAASGGPRIPIQIYDGAWGLAGLAMASGGDTFIRMYRDVAATPWPNLTNSIATIGTIIFPVA